MQLPIGYSDFGRLFSDRLDFVDKSLFIKELLDARGEQVTLITRPRRFGKTLNLSMLKYFFELPKAGEPSLNLFEKLNIHQAGEEYLQHQEKYPVVFISFKDIKENSYENMYAEFGRIISDIYGQHRYLLSKKILYKDEKLMYESVLNQKSTPTSLSNSLKKLTEYLSRYHQKKVMILIDEYDTPIQAGYLNGYYEKAIDLFRHFLGAALKDNTDLFRAVLTGIFRVSRENLFSGLNNISAYSVLSTTYSEYFGFTEKEVLLLLEKADLIQKADKIKDWYNGYKIGETILYNPWSIVNCIQKKGLLKPYWVNTSDDALIKKVILGSNNAFKEGFERLLRGNSIQEWIDENFVYADVDNENALTGWSLLLMTGYLKVISSEQTDEGFTYKLAIPNREIRSLYSKIIMQWFSKEANFTWYTQFIQNLLEGNIQAFGEDLSKILEQTVSFHDVSREPERFYHALIIGLTAALGSNPNYEIRSNRESGYGRYDYAILSRDRGKLSILFEFKQSEKCALAQLERVANQALKQITNQDYIAEIKQRGGEKILKIGIAFAGKQFALAHEKMNL